MTARGLLARGALAGLAGGLVAGLVALLVAWPALDAAVALEEAAAAAHSAAGVPGPDHGVVVGRGVQRVGGLAGLVLVGVVLGIALAAAYGVTAARAARAGQRAPRPVSVFPRCLHLGAAVLVALVVVPQLRYPALPPGAAVEGGDYAGALALGVGVVAAHQLGRSTARERGVLAPVVEVALVAAAVLLAAAGWALLPDRTGDSGLPGDLLWDFRMGAVAVQVVLVTATAALLGVFLDLAQRRGLLAGHGGPSAADRAGVPVAAPDPGR